MAQKATFADEIVEERKPAATFADQPAGTAQTPLFTREEMLKGKFAPDITERGESFTRGALDVGQGLKQLYLMGTAPEEAKKYTADVNRQIAEYQKRRGTEAGFDFPRMAGGVAAQTPAMLIPGGQASMLARLGAGAAGGALSSGAEFSPGGTFGEKAMQAAIGGTVGAVLPEVAGTVARGVTGAGQAAATALRPITSNMSNAEIFTLVQQAGRNIDFTFDIGKLGNSAREQLLKDARAQLKTSGEVSPLAIVRRQDFEKLGIDPTRGQLSRDPFQYQTEINLAQLQGIGEPLMQRFSQQPGQFAAALERVRPGGVVPAYEAGAQILEAIGPRATKTGTYGELGRAIDDIYMTARNSPGADAELPYSPFKNRITDILDNFEDQIPSPIVKRINEFAPDGGRDFSIKEAVKFRELLNSRIRASKDPAVTSPLTALKTELDSFFTEVAESSGPNAVEAIKVFREGIGASAERARAFEAPGLKAAVSGEAVPEDFVKKFVIGGKIDDLRAVKNALLRQDVSVEQQAQNMAAWEALRGQVIQNMLNRASPDGVNFSQAQYRKAYNELGAPTGKGNSKLEILFQPEEIGTLASIRRASEAAFAPPVSGGVPLANRSGTTAAAVNLMNRIPGINALRASVEEAGQTSRVASALQPVPVPSAAISSAQAALRDAAASAVGNVATRTVPPMSAPLIQQLREEDRRRKLAADRGGIMGR
jgi:hypothetical protein